MREELTGDARCQPRIVERLRAGPASTRDLATWCVLAGSAADRIEALEAALLAAREYVAGASLAAGTPAYIRCCELLIKIDGALAINSQGDTK